MTKKELKQQLKETESNVVELLLLRIAEQKELKKLDKLHDSESNCLKIADAELQRKEVIIKYLEKRVIELAGEK